MSTQTLTTLSPFSLLYSPKRHKDSKFMPNIRSFRCKCELYRERSMEFNTGEIFFRKESATARDLGVLAGSLYRESKGELRVIDAMCGCGVRSCRYLIEAKADFVLANDANDEYRGVIMGNLNKVERGFGEEKRWVLSHFEANRLLSECYLQRNFFDLIDIDSFGSDSMFLRTAMSTLKLGGLLYLTSTDGYSSGGHRPYHSLAAYGAYVRPMPYSNEIGLRMLIGGAVREASLLGYHVVPLFSYYSYHGPVFRVMFRLNRGKIHENRDYGFICYCNHCGNSQAFSWSELGQFSCSFCSTESSKSLVVSGPLWTGPLHDAAYITEMISLGKQWGWIRDDEESDLEKLLNRMLDESDPRLPSGYIKMDELGSRGKFNTPSLNILMSALHKKGFAVSRSHIMNNAIKTNCPLPICIQIAKELQTGGSQTQEKRSHANTHLRSAKE